MNGRLWAAPATLSVLLISASCGCRNQQHAEVLSAHEPDMVGSHTAGAETWKPLVDESVARLLARSCADVQTVSWQASGELPMRSVCFVGIEDRSAEPLGDFRDQIYEYIDAHIGQAQGFRMISRRYVEAAMKEIRCRPDALIIAEKQRELQAALERADRPFDYLLFARVTSGTTNVNGDYQRDYLLTLELLDVEQGTSIKESAQLRKGYHKSYLSRLKNKLGS